MVSSPLTSRQIYEETTETVTAFIFLGSKIIADCGWSHEIKRCLLFGRKPLTYLDNTLKGRNITDKGPYKVMVFPVVIYRCDSWTIKKVKHQIDAFEL